MLKECSVMIGWKIQYLMKINIEKKDIAKAETIFVIIQFFFSLLCD